MTIQLSNEQIQQDILHFEQKVLDETDPVKKEQYQKQLDLLLDAVTIYRITRDLCNV